MKRCQFSLEELIAAHLADPQWVSPQELPWASCDLQGVLQVLRENKVPLLSLTEHKENSALLRTSLFQSMWREEAEKLAGLRAEYKSVKDALTPLGISDVLIKSVGLVPSFPYTSDNLDVLYKPCHIEQVKTTLRKLGYVELRNVEEPHKYLFRKFHAGRSVSAIHVHAHVGWMVSFLDEDALWQRCCASVDDALVTIPAAEDALLITLAHCFYEDKCITLFDVLKCAYCLQKGINWDEVYRIATWRGWRDGLNAALLLYAYQESALYGKTIVPLERLQQAWQELPTWAQQFLQRYLQFVFHFSNAMKLGSNEAGIKELPLRIPFIFSKLFFYAKLIRDPTRNSTRKFRDIAMHTGYGTKLRLHIHSQPSMLVTFSGADGSGKTTQARALQSAFEACHLRTRYVWNRAGSSRLVSLCSRLCKPLLPVRRQSSVPAQKVQMRKQRFHWRWVRWAWSWLTAFELLLKYAWRVTLPLLCGQVIICDRYIYDAMADWAAYFDDSSVERRLAARALRLLTPRPKLAYWLDAPPNVTQSRSTERLPTDFLAFQSAAYQRLAQLYELRRLDAGRVWEEISDSVVYEVLSTYFADYHTLINSLFLKNPGQWK